MCRYAIAARASGHFGRRAARVNVESYAAQMRAVHDHLLSLQQSAGNRAVGALVAQRERFNKGVGVDQLTAAQAATEIGYGELPGVTFAFSKAYVAESDTKKKGGKQRTEPGFGEEFKPSIGSWVLHTHRGPGGGLLKVHTKPSSYAKDRFDVSVAKVKEKGLLKDPDGSKKPR